jgi:hypothetical protein
VRTGTCERCGESFVDRSRGQNKRFCSRNCQQRAWDHTNYRSTCEVCGAITWKKALRCAEHTKQRITRQEKAGQVVRWWAEGLTLSEIAARLGTTKGTVGEFIRRLRVEGHKLPYRHRRKDSILPEQIAA